MSKSPSQIFGEDLKRGKVHPASCPEDFAKHMANSDDPRIVRMYLDLTNTAIKKGKLFEVTESGKIITYESTAAHDRRVLETRETRVSAERTTQRQVVSA